MNIEADDNDEIPTSATTHVRWSDTRVEAQHGAVVQRFAAGRVRRRASIVDSLPVLAGQLSDPAMRFRREDIYGASGR